MSDLLRLRCGGEGRTYQGCYPGNRGFAGTAVQTMDVGSLSMWAQGGPSVILVYASLVFSVSVEAP